METYNSFNELAVANIKDEFPTVHFSATDNMTRVSPKVSVSDGQLQAKLDNTFVGAYQWEYEAPHVTIRSKDGKTARLLLSTCELMEPTKIDKDIIKAVQHDMINHQRKYVDNWNENNPNHFISLEENKNELPSKTETWKDAAWYKEAQRISSSDEEGPGKME